LVLLLHRLFFGKLMSGMVLKSKPTIVCTHQLAHCIVMLNLC